MLPFSDNIPSRRTPLVTYAIVVINLLALLAVGRLDPLKQQQFIVRHGFMPARLGQLRQGNVIEVQLDAQEERLGRLFRRPAERIRLAPDRREVFASLVTSLFLHGGWMHLLGNMWFLWVFGDNIEDRLGHGLYLGFYLVGGVVATLCHWAYNPASTTPVIGASGAIAAVLGGYVVTYPWARVRTLVILVIFITVIELPALVVLGLWFVGQLLNATQSLDLNLSGGVAWWAHVGGFLTGAAFLGLFNVFAEPAMPAVRRVPRSHDPYDDLHDDF